MKLKYTYDMARRFDWVYGPDAMTMMAEYGRKLTQESVNFSIRKLYITFSGNTLEDILQALKVDAQFFNWDHAIMGLNLDDHDEYEMIVNEIMKQN